jgi:hypothetical protein
MWMWASLFPSINGFGSNRFWWIKKIRVCLLGLDLSIWKSHVIPKLISPLLSKLEMSPIINLSNLQRMTPEHQMIHKSHFSKATLARISSYRIWIYPPLDFIICSLTIFTYTPAVPQCLNYEVNPNPQFDNARDKQRANWNRPDASIHCRCHGEIHRTIYRIHRCECGCGW